MNDPKRLNIPRRTGEGREIDYSDPNGDDFEALSRDLVLVRSMAEGDIDAIVRIDRHITHRDRGNYLRRKATEALEVSGVRVSLVAESDSEVVGFIMARVDFGEFGQADPEAVIDTIGVDPAHAHHHICDALLSQLLANLNALHVNSVRTEIGWDNIALMGFLHHAGFTPSQRIVLSHNLV